ncbi:uncharacterized protein LOC128237158 isoform X2 [Mya arenaria]|uniref:uncharacterized protein LOC128237158 isoform X2 n=1 Tax=Mya arenaria TaxID=6604 RepID=UPI0022E4EB2D|nr:uncharacterized protein LOC128237158 isoform X2 [Mya arenaria]
MPSPRNKPKSMQQSESEQQAKSYENAESQENYKPITVTSTKDKPKSKKGEPDEKEETKSLKPPAIEQPFQQLFFSCPDGLNVKNMLESHIGMRLLAEDDRRLLVRQSYPFKTDGHQACEATRKKCCTQTGQ